MTLWEVCAAASGRLSRWPYNSTSTALNVLFSAGAPYPKDLQLFVIMR
jgi:hypothetical protein